MSLSKLPPELIEDIATWVDLIVQKDRLTSSQLPLGMPGFEGDLEFDDPGQDDQPEAGDQPDLNGFLGGILGQVFGAAGLQGPQFAHGPGQGNGHNQRPQQNGNANANARPAAANNAQRPAAPAMPAVPASGAPANATLPTALNPNAQAFAPAARANPAPAPARANQPEPADRGGFFNMFQRNVQRTANIIGQNGNNPFAGMFSPPINTPADDPPDAQLPNPTSPNRDMDLDELPALESVDSSDAEGPRPTAASRAREDPQASPLPSTDEEENGMPTLTSVSESDGDEEDEDYEPSDEEEGSSDNWETDSETSSLVARVLREGELEDKRIADSLWREDYHVPEDTWSYPEGLPREVALPLALINKPFLHAARKIVYGQTMMPIMSAYQLYLFVRTLEGEQVSAFDEEKEDVEMAMIGSAAPDRSLARMVQGLEIHIACGSHAASLGRGAMDLVIKAVNHCCRLKVLKLKPNALRTAWPGLSEAMSQLTELEDVSMRSGKDSKYPMILSTERIATMAKNWPKLVALDLFELTAAATTAPTSFSFVEPLACRLTNVAFTSPKCPAAELEALLDGAIGHLEVFKLLEPGTQLTRGGLASMLCKHAPTLIKLELNIPHEWHTRSRDLPPSTSPEMSAYLLNTFISQFKKLTQLTFNGPLASSAIFGVLPPAIEVLLWGYCPAIEPQRVAKLLNLPTKAGKRRLPKLRCVTVIHDDLHWSNNHRTTLQTALAVRGACFHQTSNQMDGMGGLGPFEINMDQMGPGLGPGIPMGMFGMPVGVGFGGP